MSAKAAALHQNQLGQTKKWSTIEKVWWGFLLIVFAIGMYSLVTGYFMQGMSSTNLSNTVPWGLWIAFYIYFIGMSAGSFLLSTLVYAFGMKQYAKIGRSALLSAIVAMLTGILFVFIDIGRPDHVFNAVIYWNVTSTMSWEIHFYIVYLLLLVTELYLDMRSDLVHLSQTETGWKAKLYSILVFKKTSITEEETKSAQKTLRVLALIGIPIAIFGVHGGTGSIFAVLKSQPYLNSSLFPLIFIISALVSGTALAITIYVIKCKAKKEAIDKKMVTSLASMLALFLAIELAMMWYEFLIGLYGLQEIELMTIKLMTGSFWWWTFWIFQMGLALVFPFIILVFKKTRQSVGWVLTASIMAIIGIVGVRANMIVPTQIAPKYAGMPVGQYFANVSEWVTSFGLIALCLILYTLGEKLLPIDEAVKSEQEVINHE